MQGGGHRLYREKGLALKTKRPRRRKMATHREARCQPKAPNEAWSLDFAHDQLSNGQKIRVLAIVDAYSRLSPAIDVPQRYKGADVVATLERVTARYGTPKSIRVDNGPEFISKDLDLWAWMNGVTLDFSRPGKPTDNAFV